jgi:hypothetical protein
LLLRACASGRAGEGGNKRRSGERANEEEGERGHGTTQQFNGYYAHESKCSAMRIKPVDSKGNKKVARRAGKGNRGQQAAPRWHGRDKDRIAAQRQMSVRSASAALHRLRSTGGVPLSLECSKEVGEARGSAESGHGRAKPQ